MPIKVIKALRFAPFLFKSKTIVKPKANIIDVIINAFISQHKAEAMRFKPIIIKLWLNKLKKK